VLIADNLKHRSTVDRKCTLYSKYESKTIRQIIYYTTKQLLSNAKYLIYIIIKYVLYWYLLTILQF